MLSPVIYSASQTVPAAVGIQQFHAHLFWRSRAGLVGPDVQPLFFHMPMYLDGMEGPADGYTLMAGIIRPASRGTIKLASADPTVAPLIDPAYLSCAADVDALVAAVELCREIGAQDALGEWRGAELYPGDVDLREYVRQTAITYHHQVGSCRMGIDELAVVDPELRVHGIDRPPRRRRVRDADRLVREHARADADDRRARRRPRRRIDRREVGGIVRVLVSGA